jgi:signal transduction histidine kinase
MLTFVLLACGLALTVLSVLVLYANYKDAANRWLSGFMLSGLSWVLANLFANLSKNPTNNLQFSRLTLVGASLVPLCYLMFCIVFTRTKVRAGRYIAAFVPIVVLLCAVPTRLNIISVSPNDLSINPGIAYILLLIVFVAYFGYGSRLLLHEYRHSRQQQRRQQLYYILLGTVITVVPGLILDVVLPLLGYAQAASFGPIISLLFASTATVAILKHHLFDIRFFVVRAAAYGFTVVLISLFYLLPSIWVIAHFVHVHLSWPAFALLAVLSFLLTVAYRYMRKAFDKLTKRIFYRHYYEPQDVLDRLSDLVAHTIDIAQLQQGSGDIIMEALNLNKIDYRFQEQKNRESSLSKLFGQGRESVLVLDELSMHHALLVQLRSEDIAAVVRLRTTHGDLGYMMLGFKKSGEPYSQKDKRLLSTIADEIAISLQNALHFEEIQTFNKTLQEKVLQATSELRRTNDKLKALDETKDEFITMASHQLRTPLTSVKGYLSMVLEGDAGKLNTQQKELLTQSFISSQRMVYLIADLLNLSRLNTGKFVIEAIPVDLSEVVQGEIDQLRETAKSRGLTLAYDRPENFPKLMLDETKIHQVVMNFIDNAIYYTPSGGTITIKLNETKTAIEYRVVDDGIGVPKADQHRLFTKFYRAGNARRARPDGTGLGLFMAKKVIAAQGGAIIFESEEGKGSTFGFRFSKAKHLATAADMARTPVNQ